MRASSSSVVTQELQTLAVEDLQGSWASREYRGYLTRMHGFILPVERALQSAPNIGSYIDVRRFQKHALLRRDLMALRMTPQQIDALALCPVPWFDTPEEAFGWAYLIERNTLHHAELFRRLASTNPGDAAFAASYLKCYDGKAVEMWKIFHRAMEVFLGSQARQERLRVAAKAAIRCYESWRLLHDRPRGGVDAASAAVAMSPDED